MADEQSELTFEDWGKKGTKLFGPNRMKWRFVCPVCGHEAAVQDWIDAGAPRGAIGFSCIGRWLPEQRDAIFGQGKGPCNYAGGGLFQLNPVKILKDDEVRRVFRFAEKSAS